MSEDVDYKLLTGRNPVDWTNAGAICIVHDFDDFDRRQFATATYPTGFYIDPTARHRGDFGFKLQRCRHEPEHPR